MAKSKPASAGAKKLHVNLKEIAKPLDAINAKVAKAITAGSYEGGALDHLNHLKTTLENARKMIAAECCDNVWFCDI